MGSSFQLTKLTLWSFLFTATILLSSHLSLAQTVLLEADLSFEIELTPPAPIPAGTAGDYTITMFNAGPDPGFPVVRTSGVPANLILTGPRDDNCFFVVTDFTRPPPFPPFLVYSVSSVNLLQPGESLQCSGTFALPPDFEGSLVVNWIIGNNSGGVEAGQTTDPNSSNNTQQTVFGIASPTAVPAMEQTGVITLIVMIMSLTPILLRR